jgi:hypothetical protein
LQRRAGVPEQRSEGGLLGVFAQGDRGHPVRLGPWCGRLEGAALGVAGQAGGQGPGLRAAAGPQQQRLDDLGAPQALLRHR